MLWYEGAGLGDRRSLQADHQGSIVSVADAGGTPLVIDSYDEYGIPSATNVGRFQYTGQAWLPELGMYYYKARMYSPTLGRFLQTDPIGYKDQINLYAYVGNDPINGTDPSGMRGDDVALKAAAAAARAAAAAGQTSRLTGLATLSRLSVLTLPLLLSGDTPQPKSELLYCGITPRDAANIKAGNGIIARDPNAQATPDQHITYDVVKSQYISTSKDFTTAAGYAGPGGTVVIIDGSKVPNKTYYSNGSFDLSLDGNYLAIRDS